MAIELRRILRSLYPKLSAAGNPSPSRSRRRKLFFYVLCVLVLVKVSLLWYYYNTFVSLQYDVEESMAQIDTQLQRRKNIILNLTIMVEDYAKHEKLIFKDIANIRATLMRPKQDGKGVPPAALDAAFSKIFAFAEQYPTLKLNENFQRFMEALVDAETKIADERMTYNRRANEMSTALGVFPGNMFAWLYGFQAPPFYEPDDDARDPPKVTY